MSRPPFNPGAPIKRRWPSRHQWRAWWELRPWYARAIPMPVCRCSCVCFKGPLTGGEIVRGLCVDCDGVHEWSTLGV